MLRYLKWLILAAVLMSASKGFEAMGDRASRISEGVTGQGLPYYLPALFLLVGAAGCGIRGLWLLWQSLAASRTAQPPAVAPSAVAKVFADDPADYPAKPSSSADFDPDAALARYMAWRGQADPVAPPEPPRAGFGRRVI